MASIDKTDLAILTNKIDCITTWPYILCTDYGDFEVDILEEMRDAVLMNEFGTVYLELDVFTERLDLYEVAMVTLYGWEFEDGPPSPLD